MKTSLTRALLALCAALGALMLLGAVVRGGPVAAPLVVGLGLIALGPTTAAARRRRVHQGLARRADAAHQSHYRRGA